MVLKYKRHMQRYMNFTDLLYMPIRCHAYIGAYSCNRIFGNPDDQTTDSDDEKEERECRRRAASFQSVVLRSWQL